MVILLLAGCATTGIAPGADTDLEFASEMARMGNWREALFRWQRTLDQGRDDPRIHNNMAVAYERLGEFENAAASYERALEGGGTGIQQIQENYRQFLRFYKVYRENEVLRDTVPDE
jgi:Tfp pilus assembly protein PilF